MSGSISLSNLTVTFSKARANVTDEVSIVSVDFLRIIKSQILMFYCIDFVIISGSHVLFINNFSLKFLKIISRFVESLQPIILINYFGTIQERMEIAGTEKL